MDEDALLQKLRAVEARFVPAGPTPSTETFRAQLAEWRTREPDAVNEFSVAGSGELVFLALCLRYDLKLYRRSRRSRTPCVCAPKGFVDEVLWPQLEAITSVIDQEVEEATQRVVERWAGGSIGAFFRSG